MKGLNSVFRAVLRKSAEHLKELVRVMGTPKGIHMDTPETPERVEMGGFFPPNPPVNPPGMVGRQRQLPCPGGVTWRHSTIYGNACSTCQWIPNACSTCSGHPLPAAPAVTSNAYGSRCGAAPAANVTGFFVHGLLPRTPRWTASRCPDGYFNSQSGNWIVTRDPGSGRFTNAFTHSLSWRPGFSHYGPVGPEWTRHAERTASSSTAVPIRRTRMAGAFSEVLY